MNNQSELQGNVSLRAVTVSRHILNVVFAKRACTQIPTEARFEMLIHFRIFSDPEYRGSLTMIA